MIFLVYLIVVHYNGSSLNDVNLTHIGTKSGLNNASKTTSLMWQHPKVINFFYLVILWNNQISKWV